MKKILAIVAISAFLFSCGGNTEDNTDVTEPETEQTVAPSDQSAQAPAISDSAASQAAAADSTVAAPEENQ